MAVRKFPVSVPDEGAETASDADAERESLLQFGAMGKALSVLETVTSDAPPLTTAELARATGMTKPTAHRIVTLLDELNFLERDQIGRGYVEGPRLIDLALNVLAAAAARNVRHAVLRSVSEEVGETCNFGILVGAEVVYVDRVEAKWPLGLRFEAGSRVPAHCTAIGKLLLCRLPEDRLAEILRTMPLLRYTANTITDRDRLAAVLAELRETGMGVDDQEFMSGVVCVAVPVETGNGRIIGGIAISAPEARITLEQALAFVPAMRRAAEKLGHTFELGGRAREPKDIR